MQLQEVTLHTGRKVLKGLEPHTPAYRGRLAGKRSMSVPRALAPSSCLQSAAYYLNMYFNATYGCCTGSALVEIINMAYGVTVSQDVALAWFKAHHILNGANELDVLDWAETDPVNVNGQNYVIGPSATVNYMDSIAVNTAISSSKCVYLGIDAGWLQQVVGDVSGWVMPVYNTPIQNYDHAVFTPDYATLDQAATYINHERGVTVTIGSLDPQMPVYTLDTWGTIGIVPLPSWQNQTGECHVIESFPSSLPAPGPTPTPPPAPVPLTHRGNAIINHLLEKHKDDPHGVAMVVGSIERMIGLKGAKNSPPIPTIYENSITLADKLAEDFLIEIGCDADYAEEAYKYAAAVIAARPPMCC